MHTLLFILLTLFSSAGVPLIATQPGPDYSNWGLGAPEPDVRPSFVRDRVAEPDFFSAYEGAGVVNSAGGQKAAIASALGAAVTDIGATIMSQKLHQARQQYLESLQKDQKGALFNRRSKRFFRRRIFHAGLNWLSGLMASGFDTLNWHTSRSRTGGFEKAAGTFGHLSAAYLRTQAPRENMVSARIVAAMLTLLWRLAIVIGGQNMSEHERNVLITATRAFEMASLLAGVKVSTRGQVGALASSMMARMGAMYAPFMKRNSIRQEDPRLDIRQAYVPQVVADEKQAIEQLRDARTEYAFWEEEDHQARDRIQALERELHASDGSERDKLAAKLSEVRAARDRMNERRANLRAALKKIALKKAHQDDKKLWHLVNSGPTIQAPLERLEAQVKAQTKEIVTAAESYEEATHKNDPIAGIQAFYELAAMVSDQSLASIEGMPEMTSDDGNEIKKISDFYRDLTARLKSWFGGKLHEIKEMQHKDRYQNPDVITALDEMKAVMGELFKHPESSRFPWKFRELGEPVNEWRHMPQNMIEEELKIYREAARTRYDGTLWDSDPFYGGYYPSAFSRLAQEDGLFGGTPEVGAVPKDSFIQRKPADALVILLEMLAKRFGNDEQRGQVLDDEGHLKFESKSLLNLFRLLSLGLHPDKTKGKIIPGSGDKFEDVITTKQRQKKEWVKDHEGNETSQERVVVDHWGQPVMEDYQETTPGLTSKLVAAITDLCSATQSLAQAIRASRSSKNKTELAQNIEVAFDKDDTLLSHADEKKLTTHLLRIAQAWKKVVAAEKAFTDAGGTISS